MLRSEEVSSHLIARQAHFDWAGFEALVGGDVEIRQVWEAFSFRPPVFNNLKNSLNGLEYGFGFPPDRIRLVFAPHGPSNAYNYNDHIWQKYRIGEAMNLRDAKGELVTSNLFLKPNPALSGSADLNDERGAQQDTSIERLHERGVVFLACATALQEQARIVRDGGFAPPGLTATDIARDMLANLIPMAHLVPSMVATIAVLQQRYGYAYLTLDF
jgi:intracellular sulfur oxidation DsrE/DsrF family protein